jgi:hypothetical protein
MQQHALFNFPLSSLACLTLPHGLRASGTDGQLLVVGFLRQASCIALLPKRAGVVLLHHL